MPNDNYIHFEDNLIYISECILGPVEDSPDYRALLEAVNSQLTDCCNCTETCLPETCICTKNSGGGNYVYNIENTKLFLRKSKIDCDIMNPIFECNDLCSCSKYCGNRVVQYGPNEDLYVKSCEKIEKGLGLFTNTLVNAGTFICEYAGEWITKQEVIKRHHKNHVNGKMNYIFCLNEHSNRGNIQTFVDPTVFGNIGRYANHSCSPNSVIVPVRVNTPVPKLAIFSCRDIMPHTEITFQYGLYKSKDVIKLDSKDRKKCFCNAPNCTGSMPYEMY